MHKHLVRGAVFAVAGLALVSPSVLARELTFDERVAAQEAIERVRYSHQKDATRPFEEAVPRAVLEAKVRTYLRQSAALETVWHAPLTAERLQGELKRMARDSRMPERLLEIYAALGNDSFLIQECFARPALADRLSRNYYTYDPALHAGEKLRADALRADLVQHRIDPYVEHPDRTVVELDGEGDDAPGRRAPAGAHDAGSKVSLTQIAAVSEDLPDRVGEIGDLLEGPDVFTMRVVLARSATTVRVASFHVAKRSWNDWWSTVEGGLDPMSVVAVASPTFDLPLPFVAAGSCSGSDDTWSTSAPPSPEPHTSATAVWTGTEMIVWGGQLSSGYTNTGLRFDPVTDTWTPTSTIGAPSARTRHRAVWTGTEMIVWGGYDGSFDSLSAGGRYDPATDSWKPMSSVGEPEPRAGHSAVWTGTEMIVWGGVRHWYYDWHSALDTGGRYDPATDTWTPTSLGPAKRARHSAVWTGTEMIIWGGRHENGREASGAIYDPATDVWLPTNVQGAPETRYDHAAVWTGTKMLIWGGKSAQVVTSGGQYDRATDTWTPMSDSGPMGPPPDPTPAVVWTGTEMIVSNGMHSRRYDPGTDSWTRTSVARNPGRTDLAVWTGSVVIAWGRTGSGGKYDPAADTWTPIAPEIGPAGRFDHTAIWSGNEMIVWGGDTLDGVTSTGGRYDPVTDAWAPTAVPALVRPRKNHTAVWTGSEMIVWGGVKGTESLDSGGRYDPIADSWTLSTRVGAPEGRSGHTAVWTGRTMIVFGGTNGTSVLGTGGAYDPIAGSWTSLPSMNAPSPRSLHTAVWTGSQMLVWGGFDGTSALATGGGYTPASDTWSTLSMSGPPQARFQHTAVWTGSQMILWGGRYEDSRYGTIKEGGRYDAASDTWLPMALMPSNPNGRWGHVAVWTGIHMIVWGGENFSSINGGRYDPSSNTWTLLSPGGPELFGSRAVWTGSQMLLWGGKAGGRGLPFLAPVSRYTSLSDPDGDGVCGLSDNCPLVANADQLDDDGDGFGNVCDNCSAEPNSDQADTDGNGVGDVCNSSEDSDGDEWADALDDCPAAYDPAQIDTDGDGKGDVCDGCPTDPADDDADGDGLCAADDNCPHASNPDQSDVDADGVGDVCDNCALVRNADQTDSDDDGIGDRCDPCPFDAANDADGDAICADVDNCPLVANVNQADADADGVGNVCDDCVSAYDPGQLESDGDGVGDVCDNCPSAANSDQADSDTTSGTATLWGATATASSEFSSSDYSAVQATGAPDSVTCGDDARSWSPLTGGPAEEFLELRYDHGVKSTGVTVYETFLAPAFAPVATGFVTRIDVIDTSNVYHTVWTGSDGTSCGGVFAPTWPETAYDVIGVKVFTQADGFEEIDAVGLLYLGDAPAPDGVGDVCDNCPTVPNASQSDSDQDGIGDACEP